MALELVDNSRALLHRQRQLFRSGELSDIMLVVGQRVFSTHKLVLCMSSEVFRTMLTGGNWPEAYSRRIVLQEDPQCVEVFSDFLKYFYDGNIQLNVSNVLPLLTLSDKYNISDLSMSCLEYMHNHCVPDAEDFIISWQQYAMLCGYRYLEEMCFTYISNNFDTIMRTEEFKSLNKDILLLYLDSSELVVSSEYDLHNAVVKWANSHKDTDNGYADLFKEVLSHIRFPMMPLAQLAILETDSSVHLFKDFYLTQVFLAMKYHTSSSQVRHQMLQSNPRKKQFVARNYVCETWSTTVEVDNLGTFLPGDVTGAFFTTPVSCSEYDKHSLCDWHVDLYPKGVRFSNSLMIAVPRNLQIDGTFYRNVRLSVSANCISNKDNSIKNRFQITLLIKSTKGSGSEYICKVVSEAPLFDQNSPLFNFNHIVPYDKLLALNSPYTVSKDKLKIVIIVKPLVHI